MLMRLSESLLQRFVLGGLAEEKRREIEDLALRDEETFDLIEAMEADLVDRYVRRELPAAERKAFEQRLAPLPRIQQRIAQARVLAVAADQYSETPAFMPRPARNGAEGGRPRPRRLARRRVLGVAATLLVATIGTVLVYQTRLESGPERPDASAQAPGEPTVTYTLSPGALRDATAGQLVERAGHARIGLELDLRQPFVRPAASKHVAVLLESAARGEVIARRRVTPNELAGGTLTWVLPSGDLTPGDYTILLQEDAVEPAMEPKILANYEITVR